MSKGLKRLAVLAIGLPLAGHATDFEVYNTANGYMGDGSELAEALLAVDSRITIIQNSVQFMGSMDGSSTHPPSGGEDGDASEIDGWSSGEINNEFSSGSAAFYSNLNFGTIGDVDFVLPDGILLTSGNADLPVENTASNFTGVASGAGDAGLDNLLSKGGYGDRSYDTTVLSFDFTVPEGVNAVTLQMIFGSEEYPEYADSYPDIAAVFVDGVNYAGFANGGLFTVTSENVGALNFFNNNIWGSSSASGSDSAGDGIIIPDTGNDQNGSSGGGSESDPPSAPLAIEYDGVSRPLTLMGLLNPAWDQHNIKIAVSDTRDQALDSGLFVADLKAIEVEKTGWTSDDPLMPENGNGGNGGFNFVINVGDAGVGVDPTFPIFIDPEVAVGYIYEVTGGGAFASVVIPYTYGDGQYNLWVWDGNQSKFIFETVFGTNDTYSFLNKYPGGVTKFMIDGIETSANIDPTDPTGFVTGITFTSGGTYSVSQTPITNTVPEPSPLLLLAGGIIGFGSWRMSRKAAGPNPVS